MAGPAKVPQSTPKANPPTLKKSTSGLQSSKDQKSILGFFQKKSAEASKTPATAQRKINSSTLPINGSRRTTLPKGTVRGSSSSLTPAPSSDALEEPDETENMMIEVSPPGIAIGLPSPITPAVSAVGGVLDKDDVPSSFNSPSRKVSTPATRQTLKLIIRTQAKKTVNYAESDGEDDEEEDIFKPVRSNKTRGRALKRRKTSDASEEEDFAEDLGIDEVVDEGMTILAFLKIRMSNNA